MRFLLWSVVGLALAAPQAQAQWLKPDLVTVVVADEAKDGCWPSPAKARHLVEQEAVAEGLKVSESTAVKPAGDGPKTYITVFDAKVLAHRPERVDGTKANECSASLRVEVYQDVVVGDPHGGQRPVTNRMPVLLTSRLFSYDTDKPETVDRELKETAAQVFRHLVKDRREAK